MASRLIDRLGSKVKCHIYAIRDRSGQIKRICENRQFAEDLISRDITLTIEVWAVWGYRDSGYVPPDNYKEVVHYG